MNPSYVMVCDPVERILVQFYMIKDALLTFNLQLIKLVFEQRWAFNIQAIMIAT